METKELAVIAHPAGEEKTVLVPGENSPVFVDTYGGRVQVQWDPVAEVTPFGQLPFFIDFLKTAELFGPWVADCPLAYRSNNAPQKSRCGGDVVPVGIGGPLAVRAHHQRPQRSRESGIVGDAQGGERGERAPGLYPGGRTSLRAVAAIAPQAVL